MFRVPNVWVVFVSWDECLGIRMLGVYSWVVILSWEELGVVPSRASKPCRKWGCAELVVGKGGYCEQHVGVPGKRREVGRANSYQRGYTKAWGRARLVYLGKNPLCVSCLGQNLVVAGTEVDHIVPHRGDRQLFWDQTNWQTLCKPCHSHKTAKGL